MQTGPPVDNGGMDTRRHPVQMPLPLANTCMAAKAHPVHAPCSRVNGGMAKTHDGFRGLRGCTH